MAKGLGAGPVAVADPLGSDRDAACENRAACSGATRIIALNGLSGEQRRVIEAFVSAHPQANVYHLPAWLEVLRDGYGYRPYYVVQGDWQRLDAVLPVVYIKTWLKGRRWVALPFSHHVPALCRSPADLVVLLEFCASLARRSRARYLELKAELPARQGRFVARSDYYTTELDLRPGLERIWSEFNPKRVRWGIKKAQKSALDVIWSDDPGGYDAFYHLEVETRKRQGAPPYARHFFQSLYRRLGVVGKSRCLIAYYHAYPVAGMILLCHGETVIYGYGASLDDRAQLARQPNHLLLWHAIQWACTAGYRRFDFGITPLGNRGLLRFKQGWGGATRRISYNYHSGTGNVPGLSREGRLVAIATRILHRTPRAALRVLGPMLLKQLG